jgi:hypothetical protein
MGKVLNDLYGVECIKQNKPIWLEKTPGNAMFADYIYNWMPKIKYINIIRDGRAVALSLKNIAFAPENNLKSALDRWAKHIITALNVQLKLEMKSYIKIKYEDLVNDPDNVLRSVCSFLQVQHFKISQRFDIHNKSLAKWKDEFTKDDLDYAKKHYSELFKSLGYE